MPEVAAALRARLDRIVERWSDSVSRHLPDAKPLTVKQVRNSIPNVLEKIAVALESDRPEATDVLHEISSAHGVARFQEDYDVEELLVEYRLLRRAVFDELTVAAGAGGALTLTEVLAVDMGIDIAVQRGVAEFNRHLTEQLRSAAEAQSRYLAFVSHDLRNNLNGVTLSLEWLAQRLATAPDFREEVADVRHLQRSVAQTMEGMDRLLQSERLRQRELTLKLGPVDLHALTDELIALAARAAQEKGLRLENRVPPGAAAYSDRELVTLVLQNLIGNAVKFTRSGGARVEAHDDPLGWRVAVVDTGPGIAPDRVRQLFDAFSRGETHGQAGVGLGLHIAARAARLLGSDLRVESEPGRGTTFSFTVPPAKPEEAR